MLAESLGGVESIVGYPPLMSHGCMTEEQRIAMELCRTACAQRGDRGC